tara:strand:- start:3241 stop:3738 length:498 start_codon:yes stop_codon:yes gene_type:complete
MKKILAASALACLATPVLANNTPISGVVESRCLIVTEVTGIYGNPAAHKLSTKAADGGVLPKIRTDVSQADAYKVKFTTPEAFSSSPTLSDSLAWTGEITVSAVGVAGMSVYETNKVEYNNHTEYDMTLAGSTWFTVESTVEYGSSKSLPGGEYSAIVTATCIPK